MKAISNSEIVGVIGAGAMGAGIAQVAASAGHEVLIYDMSLEAASKAIKNINSRVERLCEKGIVSKDVANNTKRCLKVANTFEDMNEAHLIVEAIVENLEVKQQLFAQLEEIVHDFTILTSNTSSLSITAIGSILKSPDRFAGFHFFNPAPRMPLVEIVSGLATSKDVATSLYKTAEAWGKKPVYAKSTPGFIVNRVARPYYAEALRVFEEGVADHATIDCIVKECADFKMGPFELMDLIGHDVNYAVTKSVFEAYFHDPRYRPSLVQQELVAAGWFGQKSSKGFYTYSPKKIDEPIEDYRTCDKPNSINIEGDLGFGETLVSLWQTKDIHVDRGDGNGIIRVNDTVIAPTNGLSASERMHAEAYDILVLFDYCADFQTTPRIVLTAAGKNKDQNLDIAAGLFQALDKKISIVGDTPGMVVFRTIAMLANEACEALLLGVANSIDLDKAMKLGVNYPKGPLAWADEIGAEVLHAGLANIFESYKDIRYRPSTLFSNRVFENTPLFEK